MKILKTFICLALTAISIPAFAVQPQPNASTSIAFKDACNGNVVPSVGLNGVGTDVYVVTTTTSTGIDPLITPTIIDQGKVQLQIAVDAAGNPTTVAGASTWVRIDTAPMGGATPSGGVACFAVDLDNLASLDITVGIDPVTGLPIKLKNVTCNNTTVGFRAHYIGGGGNPHAGEHFSAGTPLTIECDECGTST